MGTTIYTTSVLSDIIRWSGEALHMRSYKESGELICTRSGTEPSRSIGNPVLAQTLHFYGRRASDGLSLGA